MADAGAGAVTDAVAVAGSVAGSVAGVGALAGVVVGAVVGVVAVAGAVVGSVAGAVTVTVAAASRYSHIALGRRRQADPWDLSESASSRQVRDPASENKSSSS